MDSENTPTENINIQKARLAIFFENNKKYIFSLIAVVSFIFLGSFASSQIQKKQNIKISTIFYNIFFSEDDSQKIIDFDLLYNEHKSAKIAAIAALNHANLLIQQKKTEEAIEIYKQIARNKSYDQFIIDFASFAALKHMIAYDYKKFDNQITQYLKILTKEKNNKLKYHIFEQEAVFLWLKNDKANAKEKFLKLANAVSGEINLKIKKRAKIMLKNL